MSVRRRELLIGGAALGVVASADVVVVSNETGLAHRTSAKPVCDSSVADT